MTRHLPGGSLASCWHWAVYIGRSMGKWHALNLGRPAWRVVWPLLWLGMYMASLAACQTPQPAPTPTATRTPVVPTSTATPTLTPTPTASPTMTPVPTPTTPPDLWLPPDAVEPATCPPGPAELFFLRDHALWICPRGGGMPFVIPQSPAIGGDIVDFQVTADGRVALLLTNGGLLYAFDREANELILVPTVGQLWSPYGTWMALSPSGTDVLYLAWGVQPDRGPTLGVEGSATLMRGSIVDPRAIHRALAYCEGSPDRPCRGFLLSPDGSAVMLGDQLGFWYIPLVAPENKQLVLSDPRIEATLLSWSPDGHWVLLESVDSSRPALTLLRADPPAPGVSPASWYAVPLCIAPCRVGSTWSSDSLLWISWETGSAGCVAHFDLGKVNEDALVPITRPPALCETDAWPLRPWSPDASISRTQPMFVLAFLQSKDEHRAEGLYVLANDNHIEPIALLPDGTSAVLWAPDGNAFLTLDREGHASRMGVLLPPMLFDVANLLGGAHHFVWSVPGEE